MTIINETQRPAPKKYIGAGIILTRVDGGLLRVLLLCGRKTNIWSFSKGHPEHVDQGVPLRTAVRETEEETGLINGRDYIIYGPPIRFCERYYWVGIVGDNALGRLRLAPREHSMAGWFTVAEVASVAAANADVRAWVKKCGPAGAYTRIISSVTSTSTMKSRHYCAPECIVS